LVLARAVPGTEHCHDLVRLEVGVVHDSDDLVADRIEPLTDVLIRAASGISQ
jgi:hypothetical protein